MGRPPSYSRLIRAGKGDPVANRALRRIPLHAKQRWENLPTAVRAEDLGQDEILRTLRLGAAVGRMPASVSEDPADVLDRLGLRVRGQKLNAAVVVFGRRMLPDFLSAN